MRSVSSGMARVYRGKIDTGENFVSYAHHLSHISEKICFLRTGIIQVRSESTAAIGLEH